MFGVGIGIRVGGTGFGGGGGFDPAAQAYIDALAADGYPLEAPEQTYINTLVTDFKSAGIWSKMKAIYPYCTSQRNLIGYSEDFGNAAWSKTGATVTTNDILAPNGTLTADKVVFSSSSSEIFQGISSSGNFAVSVYVKGTSGETISFSDGVGIAGQLFTLNGTWQRIQFSTTASNYQFDVNTYSGATARTIWLWGAQLELGSTATTYQPIIGSQQGYVASQMKYNLINPQDTDAAFRLIFNGGWTFDNNGATPNGTNGYADTKLSPSTSLSTSSAHLSFYSRTNSNGAEVEIGSQQPGPYYDFLEIRTSGVSYYSINSSSYDNVSDANSQGFYIGNRTLSNDVDLFKSGTKIKNGTATSSLRPNQQLYLCAFNNNGTTQNYSTKECAFSSIGSGLTDTEAANFYTAVQAFQTTLSRNV